MLSSLLPKSEPRMVYSVRVTDRAHESVMSSVDYIVKTLRAPHAAAHLLESYDAALNSLRVNPTFNPLDTTATRRYGRSIYRKSVRNYALFYYVEKDASEVVIFSFLHKHQDTAAHLFLDYEKM